MIRHEKYIQVATREPPTAFHMGWFGRPLEQKLLTVNYHIEKEVKKVCDTFASFFSEHLVFNSCIGQIFTTLLQVYVLEKCISLYISFYKKNAKTEITKEYSSKSINQDDKLDLQI